MKENVSPEEKLLNLIKNQKSDTKNQPQEAGSPNNPGQKDLPIPKKTKERKVLLSVSGKIKGSDSKIYSFINKLLIAVMLISISYAVWSYFTEYKSETGVLERQEEKSKQEKGDEITVSSRPLSHYNDIISGRQIFKVFEKPAQKPTGPAKPKVTLAQLLGGYTFVGIIFGDVPQAIVEEKKSGQSFYLTEGQMLGEIKVEKIEAGKITVSYEEERMDVRI